MKDIIEVVVGGILIGIFAALVFGVIVAQGFVVLWGINMLFDLELAFTVWNVIYAYCVTVFAWLTGKIIGWTLTGLVAAIKAQ